MIFRCWMNSIKVRKILLDLHNGLTLCLSRQANNQFLNFEQRNTDYDSLVLNQVKDWIGEQ